MRNEFTAAAARGWLMLTAVGLTACSGSGEGLDDNGRPVPPAPPPPPSAFKTIQDTIFTPLCTGCHAGASAPRGLRLEDGVSYAALVNVNSAEVPALLRVKPGDPDNSYLVHKIEGRAAVGARMPLGGPPLPQSSIDLIKQWILDGAQPASFAPAGQFTTLKTVTPVEEAELPAIPQAIIVTADGELDTTLLTATNVSLLKSGGDGSFAEGNEVAVRGLQLSVRSLMPTVFAVTIPAEEWLPERYLLAVNGTGANPVTDRAAIAIDGDVNGAAGGDFIFSFVIKSGETP